MWVALLLGGAILLGYVVLVLWVAQYRSSAEWDGSNEPPGEG